jgi:hypothetical protein
MILLEFIFQSPFHFFGCLILLAITYSLIDRIFRSIARIFCGRE